MENRLSTILQEHYDELAQAYKGLILHTDKNGPSYVRGTLKFRIQDGQITIEDAFEIELLIPKKYPSDPPVAFETGGRIPGTFHKYSDKSLCLGTPLEIRMKFKDNPTLLAFTREQVIPFLYSFCYYERYGKFPYGEHAHGGQGILESYRCIFHIDSGIATLGLLKILAEDNYRGHHDCPCGSGKKLRHCHGNQILEIIKYQNQDDFIKDYIVSMFFFKESGHTVPLSLYSEKIMKRFSKKVKDTVT
jgi:hypothetical protein